MVKTSFLGHLLRFFDPRKHAQKVSFSPLCLLHLFESANDLQNQKQKGLAELMRLSQGFCAS